MDGIIFIFGLVCSLLGSFRVEGMESRTLTYRLYKIEGDGARPIDTFQGKSLEEAISNRKINLESLLSSNNLVIVHTQQEGDVHSLYAVTTDQMKKITDFNEYNKVLALMGDACTKFCDPKHIAAFKGDEENDIYKYNGSIFVLDKFGHRIRYGCFLDDNFNPKKPYKYFIPGFSKDEYSYRLPLSDSDKTYFETQYKSVYSSPAQGGGSKSGPSSSSSKSNSCCC